MAKKNKATPGLIANNKKAFHDYSIEQKFEAGIMLEGWEIKSIRAGQVQLRDSYVICKRNEIWLIGATITPLLAASTHIQPEPQRTRKLLLNRKEINQLIGAVQRDGYTLVALNLHWKHNRAKAEIGLAKGKKQHDKRQTIKQREWAREKQRLMKPK